MICRSCKKHKNNLSLDASLECVECRGKARDQRMTRFRESERQRLSYLAEDVLSKAAGADLKLDHTRLAERVEQAAGMADEDSARAADEEAAEAARRAVPTNPAFLREIADDAQKLLGMLGGATRRKPDSIRDFPADVKLV